MRQVGESVMVRKPDQAVGVFTIPAYGTYYVRETAVSGDMMLNDSVFGPLTYSETNRADNPTVVNTANVGSLTVELRDEKKEKLGTQPAAIDYMNAADLAKFPVSVDASNLAEEMCIRDSAFPARPLPSSPSYRHRRRRFPGCSACQKTQTSW